MHEPDPTPQAPVPEEDRTLLLRMLYDEQARLRNEVEGLREQKSKDGEKDEEKEDGKKNEKSEDDKKKEKDEQKKKEKQKPLVQRVRAVAVEHPVATVLGIAGVILLVVLCILLLIYLSSYEDTDDAFVDGHTDPISARVNGYVSAMYVEDTYRVKKGQLLAVLDPRDNEVAKEQAAAGYSQSQAAVRAQQPNVPLTQSDQSTMLVDAKLSVASAEANVSAAKERHASALADLRQAEANAANAQREEERYRELVVKEEVSREIYDQHATEARAQAEVVASRRETADAAQKSVTQAQAQLDMARAEEVKQIHDLPRQVAIQRETLAQRQANSLSAKAQADQAELNLEYTRIYAPEDGIVGDKQAQLGTQVAPGQELFAITQTNDLWVTANFKETEIRKMHAGEKVDIYVDALDETFHGHVEALPGASGAIYSLIPPENATGNYVKVVQRLPVRIRFEPGQPDAQRLAPGMSVVPKVWLR